VFTSGKRSLLAYIFFLMSVRPMNSAAKAVVSEHINSERKVFAHYMVCCPTQAADAGVNDFKKEIIEAQKRGVDGFVLNAGGWNLNEPVYKRRVLNIYEAAKQLGTGFLLFMSADDKARAEIEDMIVSFRNHPNQFRYKGKPVISTFSGGAPGDPLTRKVHQLGGVIVPYYFPSPVTELPELKHATYIMKAYPDIDGFFYFGAAGAPSRIAESIVTLSTTLKAQGKLFMAGITPYYRGNGKNFRLFETHGFEGMAQEWKAAITSGATWIELVTWNDWGESTYLAPLDAGVKPKLWDGHFGQLFLPHNAYLDASKYYIDWFKRGRAPVITKDQLYYFYRLHRKDRHVTVNAANDKKGFGLPSGSDQLIDNIYVTLFLTKAARLLINSGDSQIEFQVAAGVQHVSMPFKLGVQRFRLIRDSKVLIDKIGEYEINNKPAGRFNYFSGDAQ
jgi:glucan endo-1,3-alpha-glucosidase